MGKILVAVKVQNLRELDNSSRGEIPLEQVRAVSVADALVDTGATGFSAPRSVIDQLGLQPTRARMVRTAGGLVQCQMYEAVQLTIQGRECIADVAEVPAGCPVLVGQVPLELLDFVVDPVGHRLIGNPAHGSKHMMEMYAMATD